MVILRLGFNLRIRGRNSWQLKPVDQSESGTLSGKAMLGLKEDRTHMEGPEGLDDGSARESLRHLQQRLMSCGAQI